MSTTPIVKALNTAHNSKLCSTWGNFHYKNFDGDIFYFPGTCNYVFASHCKSSYEDFNIQIRRQVINSVPVIDKITMKLDGLDVQINHSTAEVGGEEVQLPFSGTGVQIEKLGVYLKVSSKNGLVFMWNDDDSLLLELDDKYANQTCGLCGDYNGISTQNEFISNGIKITETQFGNLQKLDGPTELCQDPPATSRSNCTDFEHICEEILMGTTFASCHSLVGVDQYIEVCVQDLCRCDSNITSLCLCDTFAEYSRQCAHAGGQPENWRTKDLCPRQCPYGMEYRECGSPCADTCSNPERGVLCEDHCLEGCFCPPGTIYDDINNSGCVPTEQCSCTHNNNIYDAGTSFSTPCSTCLCSSGKWKCQNVPCPATCSIEGGSHITTYDQTHYNIHGDCNYVMSKMCSDGTFTILSELRKCGLTESETCFKSATIILNSGETTVVIKPCGSVYVNNIFTQLPISAASVTIFRPSSFYIVVQSTLGIQVVAQLTPSMQVYVVLDPSFKGKTCGLCGNYNDKQTDDFQTISGVIEGTAASFANTWKTQGDCPNVKNVYEDPCSLSVENEKYAEHWCGLISDPSGPFASCHSLVNPTVYQQNCRFDTCNCEKSEDCMCAALSSYVRACAAKEVILTGWRTDVCTKYMKSCPMSLNYNYSISTCQPTCRSLSEPDVTCSINFVPVDGCTCNKGYYMDDTGKCVPVAACPCYYKGTAVPAGEVVYDNGAMCTCTQGKLNCIGSSQQVCTSPMVYFDCKNTSDKTKGAECQKSCQTLDMECYTPKCVSGCVCPLDLVSDGKGGCIKEEQCPCIHNDAAYQPGEKIKMNCNTCTCKNRMWQCTSNPCLGTCAVYGDGHYLTFDGKRYSFNGDCEYTLAQDHCGQSGNSSTFRVITENIPCGTTGTTCSKAIKIFLGSYELILTDDQFAVIERGIGDDVPYKVRPMGIYLVLEADNGLILMWDKKTSIFIKLSSDFEGKVCGLCGDYDGSGVNDFTTRSMSVVEDVIEFGNSWKFSPSCPDAKANMDPCSANPYRKSWAQKQCSIITSDVFSSCRVQVDPSKYYDACVTDSCACDTGGDCECFCTAIAAYAQACGEAGICVSWRTPNICPLFCDYYNPVGECEWHYKPCGAPCMKTCRNPTGKCVHELSGLEGCYPSCPAEKPYFDEDDMECVAQCGCYDKEGNHYKPGSPVPTTENCQSCDCAMSGISCSYNKAACHCEYNGIMYNYNDVIYNTTDGIGGCLIAICKEQGTIYRAIHACIVPTTPATTPFTFTTTQATTTIEITTQPSTTEEVTTSTPSTTHIDTTTSKKTTTTESTVKTTTSTTHCFCKVNDSLFLSGDVIYDKMDKAGCRFYSICNDKCEPESLQGECLSTTTLKSTTTTTTTTVSTTTKSKTSTSPPTTTSTTTTTTTLRTAPPPECSPRRINETWMMDNCTNAKCIGRNVISIETKKCPTVKQITCDNGFEPVKVYSEDGCCYHYECECICSGWGDPHYITFDGTYYTFLDNCTYVLVQQITPKYDNFRILVDNYFCDAEDGLSCPQSLLIYYKSTEVILTRVMYQRRMTNRIRFNQEWVNAGFTKNGITVTSAGINMIVQIPEINAYISFSGMIFVIRLPFSKFGYNTEGQCGTCSNNNTEDCRLPNGRIIEDCSLMAPEWKVNVTDKPYCNVPPTLTTPTPIITTTPPPKVCQPAPLCDIIFSEVFAECHEKIPPNSYHEGCLYDACRISNDTVQCSSLEIYASLCTSKGICVDWRGKTKGRCPYNCASDKVYNACGPVYFPTCDNTDVKVSDGLTEGCFCPQGTKLFNSYCDLCVKNCSCVGPDGMPKKPSETWINNCQECVCKATTLTVECKPLTCADPAPVSCERNGFVAVQIQNPDQPCCLKNECRCNVNYCSNEIQSCPLGFTLVSELKNGDCCPSYTCVHEDVCVVDNAKYMVGYPIPTATDSCKQCVCTAEKDSNTLFNMISCNPTPCNTVCEEGFKYVKMGDQCCGTCVKDSCKMTMDDGSTVTLQPGEIWNSPTNKCSYYECNKTGEHYVTVSISKECTVYSEDDCSPGYKYKTMDDQCCGICEIDCCIMTTDNGSAVTLQPGDILNHPTNKCSFYECQKNGEQYVILSILKECTVYSADDCSRGYKYKKMDDQCCGICEIDSCIMNMDNNSAVILQASETWINNCQECLCKATTLTVECKPLTCADPAPVSCERNGFVAVQIQNPDQPCCLKNECRCNVNYCSNEIQSCPLGFTLVSELKNGDCCSSYTCVHEDVCVVDNAKYMPDEDEEVDGSGGQSSLHNRWWLTITYCGWEQTLKDTQEVYPLQGCQGPGDHSHQAYHCHLLRCNGCFGQTPMLFHS
ncbi:mucin-5B-like [Discoglossus pictus]